MKFLIANSSVGSYYLIERSYVPGDNGQFYSKDFLYIDIDKRSCHSVFDLGEAEGLFSFELEDSMLGGSVTETALLKAPNYYGYTWISLYINNNTVNITLEKSNEKDSSIIKELLFESEYLKDVKEDDVEVTFTYVNKLSIDVSDFENEDPCDSAHILLRENFSDMNDVDFFFNQYMKKFLIELLIDSEVLSEDFSTINEETEIQNILIETQIRNWAVKSNFNLKTSYDRISVSLIKDVGTEFIGGISCQDTSSKTFVPYDVLRVLFVAVMILIYQDKISVELPSV